jgi:hypothetical protein
MSIFGKISEAIFGRRAQPRGLGQSASGTVSGTTGSTGAAAGTTTTGSAWWLQPSVDAAGRVATEGQQAQAISETDVAATLEQRAASHDEQLNWRTSIVDLMKLLGIDSSLENRTELARELGYAGDTNDSATMNIWLHRQVMRELAANGGTVPAELTD